MKIIHSLLLTASLTSLLLVRASAEAVIPDDCKVGEFFVGTQAYTFHRFTAFEAIEKTAAAGGKTIEFYPGQGFSPAEPKLHLDHHLSPENIAKLKAELDKFGVRAVSYGVVVGNNEADWRQIFEFAKGMGFYGITTDTSKAIADLDIIEKLVKEFDLHVGIHDHAKQDNDPNYKNWDPAFIYASIKDRDPRIGACADTGHWQTSGLDALEGIKMLHGRIVSLHLKDRTEPGPHGHDAPFGTGTGKIAPILDELKAEGFKGHVDMEYEYNEMDNEGDVKKCIDFMRAYHPK